MSTRQEKGAVPLRRLDGYCLFLFHYREMSTRQEKKVLFLSIDLMITVYFLSTTEKCQQDKKKGAVPLRRLDDNWLFLVHYREMSTRQEKGAVPLRRLDDNCLFLVHYREMSTRQEKEVLFLSVDLMVTVYF